MTQSHKITLNLEDFAPQIPVGSAILEEAKTALHSLKNRTCKGSEWTGWLDWPHKFGMSLNAEIKHWMQNLSVSYDTIIAIGIGGSYLGAKAVYDLMVGPFGPTNGLKNLYFAGQNMSESALSELIENLNHLQRKPLIVAISKTGTTTEPGVAFRVLREWCESKFCKAECAQRIIAITDPKKGALRQLALQNGYKTFEVPSDVGGRYSVFTAVGQVPLMLAGLDVKSFLDGADQVFAGLMGRDSAPSLDPFILQYAAARTAAWRAGKRMEVVTYPEPKMRNFVEWFKQLYGESDGKEHRGLFPGSLECTMDLHSMGQYLQEGARTMIETFIVADNPRTPGMSGRVKVPAMGNNLDELQYLEGKGVDDINHMALLATRKAHASGLVPVIEMRLGALDLPHIGALMAALQVSCPVGGILLGINPFDQPGVEAYKVKMFELLGKPKS
jgi:glucose-6-phosphate isomerase